MRSPLRSGTRLCRSFRREGRALERWWPRTAKAGFRTRARRRSRNREARETRPSKQKPISRRNPSTRMIPFSSVHRDSRFRTLEQSGLVPGVAKAIEDLVETGSDADLCRVNVLAFAERLGLDSTDLLHGFLHAAKLGLFDMAWNVCCPGCGGVLDGSSTLKAFVREKYPCALCATAYEPTLDELVEVTFSVSPGVRRIAGHTPDALPIWEYYRQMYFGSGLKLPDEPDLLRLTRTFTIETEELGPGERVVLSLNLAAEFLIVFDPVTHSAHFLDTKGEPTT